jgi:hypothetical protein
MSSQSLTNTIHLRDFVDEVTGDPTRADVNYIEIRTDVNICEEDQFYTPDVAVEPIRARIRAYTPQVERELLVPNTFIYVDGRFSTTVTPSNELQMTIHALSLKR